MQRVHLRVHMIGKLIGIVIVGVFLSACSTPPPAPPPPPPPEPIIDTGPPEPEPIDSNKKCIKAEGFCDAGICAVDVTNGCDAPLTCEIKVMALCKGSSTAGNARAATHATVTPGSTTKLETGANCEGAAVAGTVIEELNCK